MNAVLRQTWSLYCRIGHSLRRSPLVRLWIRQEYLEGIARISRKLLFTFVYDRPIHMQGFQMIITTKDDPGFPVNLLLGNYEPGATDVFNAVLRPGMTVVDIGANRGYFSLLSAKLVGPYGRVYAFEPEPHNYGLLLRNINLNKLSNILPLQLAVSNADGTGLLFLDPANPGGHTMYADPSLRPGHSVKTTTLDCFLSERGWPSVNLIKIDIEGGEPAALEGMRETLRRNASITMI